VDIKAILGIIGLVITLGGMMVTVGKIMNRLDVVEARSAPNIKPLEQGIAINKAEIAVLKSQVVEIKARSDNPLQ
tara:strand:- start:50 stop:274 length:225 start_codon:yes stop_codon:yes gene_type:complete